MRLHYNLLATVLNADIDDNDTAMDLTAALTEGGVNIPTFSSPDTLDLSIGPPGGLPTEVVTVTAYTAGDTTAIVITRGSGDTDAVAHAAGSIISNAPAKADFVNDSSKAYRYTDAAGPFALSANILTVLTEAIMDAEDYAETGIAWENANDGYRISDAGLYLVASEALLDSNTETAGQADMVITGGVEIGGPRSPKVPYGSALDMTIRANGPMWVEAGGIIKTSVRSTEALDVTYAEIQIHRVLPGA